MTAPLLLALTLSFAVPPAAVELPVASSHTSASARHRGLYLMVAPLAAVESTGIGRTVGGGGGGITSGTTTITGGNNTSVCFDDAGVMNCSDTGLLFAKAANTLTVLGNIELGHASANTLSASSGVLSIEGVALVDVSSAQSITGKTIPSFELGTAATDTTITRSAAGIMAVEGKDLLDVSSNQTITAGTKTFQGGTLTVKSTGSGNPSYLDVPALTLMTGADNICVGMGSCAAVTTGNSNVAIGSNAFDNIASSVQNVCIGMNACTGTNPGNTNVAVGYAALDATTSTAAAANTALGKDALGSLTSGSSNVGIGQGSGVSITTGNSNTHIGDSSGANSNVSASIAIGASARATASNQMAVGGNALQVTDVYWSEGVTNASPLDVTHNATGGSGTDIAGAAYRSAGGKGTGTGLGGAWVALTAPSGSTGSTLNSLAVRDYIYAGTKTLTAGSATDVVRIAIATREFAGGLFQYCVRASDATDDLMRCGQAEFSAVNKGGTETCTIATIGTDVCSDTVTPGTCAVSTLTAALTCTSSTADTVDIEINAAAAITETTLNAGWRLQMNYGTSAATVTPQ